MVKILRKLLNIHFIKSDILLLKDRLLILFKKEKNNAAYYNYKTFLIVDTFWIQRC